MSEYHWQDGDYILSADLSLDDYREAAAQWIAAGVGMGEFPETNWLRDLEAFGVKDGELYHGDCDGDSFANGRRVELVDGRLQVAGEGPKPQSSHPLRLTIELPGSTTVHDLGAALEALNAKVVRVDKDH